MIDWDTIETVLLDMDGTLLDLNFDNQFWRELVPERYAALRGISVEAAKSRLFPMFQAAEGTMDWYCVDYWTRQLDLDIALLKSEIDHLIAIHPHVPDFLEATRRSGRRVVLVTNAHQKSLALKMERTKLEPLFDEVVCSHEFGIPKENHSFWPRLQERHHFHPGSTLLVDDSLPVLRSARAFGIAHLLGVHQPDSRGPAREAEEFPVLRSFLDIMPGEQAAAAGQ